MKKLQLLIFTLSILLVSGFISEAAPSKLSLKINQKSAVVDGQKIILDTAPAVINGSTYLPLNFFLKMTGSSAVIKENGKKIYLDYNKNSFILLVNQKAAYINGQKTVIGQQVLIVKGRTFLPIRLAAKIFEYNVSYNNKMKTITMEKLNSPPIARFEVVQESEFTGSSIRYDDLSYDPDGDKLVASIWQNNKTVFETPGVYTIRLKVKDSKGSWSDWAEKTIEVKDPSLQKPVALFGFIKNPVYVNEKIEYVDQSYSTNNAEITEWQWDGQKESFDKPGLYKIGLRVKDINNQLSDWCWQTIEVKEIPNQKPAAKFSLNKLTFDQGETVTYTDESSDPDGDQITECRWTGKQRAFFKEGKTTITLEVKDAKGLWSNPFSQDIEITSNVIMNEMEYNLKNPLPGEIVNLNEINPTTIPVFENYTRNDSDTTLLLSDSPESVYQDGIMYQDTVRGPIRLMYYHRNGSQDVKKIYVLAVNKNSTNVKVRITKSGIGGPSESETAAGRAAVMRYLASNENREIELEPGKIVVFAQNEYRIKPSQNICGIIDLYSEGDVTFYFVMAGEKRDAINELYSLMPLEKDMHQRGTFKGADRYYSVSIMDMNQKRMPLVDSSFDKKAEGIDAMTNTIIFNKGNYGIMYHIKVYTARNVGILTNPRGGTYAGACILPDGTVVKIPEFSISSNTQAVMNMVINRGDEQELVFMPSGPSNLPIALLFIPFEDNQ